jgi:ribosomal protein L28
VKYELAAGQTRTVRLRLSAKRLRALRRAGLQKLTAVAVNADAAGGTRSSAPLTVKG